jgi:glycosyltransferase involved in cell wall biosynthesis
MRVFDSTSLRYEVIEPPVSAGKPQPARNDGTEARRNPLVTCVMITRGVIPILSHSAECFRRQNYANRELVVVSERDAHNDVQAFFRSHDYNNVKLVRVPFRLPLGNLRNIGISYSSGDIIAQWDDDDLCDPDRLKDSVDVLLDCGRAAAAILSRVLIWWPARKLLFISELRAWEGSMIAWRSTIPIYPALEKGEDASVLRHMHHNYPLALIERPSFYVYTVTGRNTWDQDHFEMFLRRAKAVFRDQEYDRALEHLQNRVPIHEYEKDIRSITTG